MRHLKTLLVLLFIVPITAVAQNVAVLGAPATDSWNDDVVAKVSAAGSFTTVDGMLVSSMTPTLADLQAYDSVLVYSDRGYADPVALGDVLADYLDAGGNVVLATFSYNVAIGGRIVSDGYLPFTLAGQASPGGLTLVPVIADHPLLEGVTSFNGGTSSYHNTIDLDNGAELVAEWSNGRPLIGVLTPSAGTVIGLNFYPPSSDARSDFWDVGTDGDILLANALGANTGPVVVIPPYAPVPSLGGLGLVLMALVLLIVGSRRLYGQL